MSVPTPFARVEGLGAAHSGTSHFWRQRLTATALVPLSLWFAWCALALTGAPRSEVIAFFSHPANAIAMALFIVAALHHMVLGAQVVIEDYVHDEGPKIVLLVINQFFAWVVGAACLFALARMAF